LDSGTIIVTNAAHTAVLEARNGTLILNGGTLQVDTLVMTNACGLFIRNGGTLTIGTLVLDPNLSAVGDGIPNGWKQQYGLDPLNPDLANEDLDGTGFTVLQDYLAGIDPTNGSSAFRITAITPVGADVRVYFMSVGGKYYSLQRCDFMGGAWASIVTNIPGNGGIQWATDIGGAVRASAFYRILLSQLSSPKPASWVVGDPRDFQLEPNRRFSQANRLIAGRNYLMIFSWNRSLGKNSTDTRPLLLLPRLDLRPPRPLCRGDARQTRLGELWFASCDAT
jgi:hypothetical protein